MCTSSKRLSSRKKSYIGMDKIPTTFLFGVLTFLFFDLWIKGKQTIRINLCGILAASKPMKAHVFKPRKRLMVLDLKQNLSPQDVQVVA